MAWLIAPMIFGGLIEVVIICTAEGLLISVLGEYLFSAIENLSLLNIEEPEK